MNAFIAAATRTAGGRRNGKLSGWHPADLAAQIINRLLASTKADPALIDDVIMGCVSQAGEQSTNIARNAVLASLLPESVPGTSVDRQCGSSQQAVHFAAQAVMSGAQDIVIAAGVESMSRVPMGMPSTLPRSNGLGHYVSPGMQQRYAGAEFSQFRSAETIARKFGFEKADLDAYALGSHQRAIRANEFGEFRDEILPVAICRREAGSYEGLHTVDEGIRFDATLESIAAVKLISDDGRFTAASVSQICDGAAGLMIVNERGLKQLGIEPLARIHHMTVIGDDPVVMLEAPLRATDVALRKSGMKIEDIGLYEVNEAFASIPLAWLRHVSGDYSRLNVNGGAIALGHPLGASGAKLMTTLVHALRRHGQRYGVQTMCEGGGLANVTIIESA
jgi:acetyl-CoA C-acetyltransferase